MATFLLYLLGYRAGAEVEGLDRYLERRLGIDDPGLRKKLLYDTPSLLMELDDEERAAALRRELEDMSARVELKTRPATAKPVDVASQNAKPDKPAAGKPSRPSGGMPYVDEELPDLPPMAPGAKTRSWGKYALWGVMLVLGAIIGWEYYTLISFKPPLKIPSIEPVVVSSEIPENGGEIVILEGVRPPESIEPIEADEDSDLARAADMLDNGKVQEALPILQRWVAQYPDDPEGARALVHAWILNARESFEEGEVDSAIDSLLSALSLAPERPDINAQLGALHYAKKEYDSARYYLDDALRYGSDDANVHVILAMIYYYHRDDLEIAQRHLDKAVEAMPERIDLIEFREKIRRERRVEDTMEEATGVNFIVKYEGIEDEDAGYTVLYELENAYNSIGYDLGEYPPDPVTVILYTRRQFQEITGAPHWAGGVYDGRIRLPVGGLSDRDDDDLKRMLYHEYTHAVIHRITDNKCPIWLNEGLAQIMQERSGASKDPWLKVGALQGGALITLGSLSLPFVRLDGQMAQMAYTESYYATRYLIREYGMTGVRYLLQETAKKNSFHEAFSSSLGLDFKTFENRFYDHLKTVVE